ncbi:ATP-binding protein [Bacillus sp. Bva_UNVM-123]|uniref:ATP-binding protein n=1 Tax=Bacillus sp. Bva_UNVM-123 TaxID=2829798 RepID=UPI00391FA336
MITSNLSFDRWEEVFYDPVLTAALTDRLTHRAHVINMVGNSYRIYETKEMIEKGQL